MGFFSNKKQAAEEWTARANEETNQARKEARKADAYRKSLKSGKSSDPAADRYMIREHDANRRIAEANAKTCQSIAKQTRKWF